MQVNALWLRSHTPAIMAFCCIFCCGFLSPLWQSGGNHFRLLTLSLSLSLYPQPCSGNHTTNMALFHRVFVKKYPISKKIYVCILRWTLQVTSEHVQVTNSMQQSPTWEDNRFSAGQEVPHISCSPKVHYRIHKSSPPFPILSQNNPVPATHPTSWRSILISSYHLLLGHTKR